MKLRLINKRNEWLLLCPNGSILKADEGVLQRLLYDFRKPNSFKGDDGCWNTDVYDMETASGETLAFVDDAHRLIILSNKIYSSFGKNSRYISATEYAELHGKSRPSVKNMCAAGRIEGAYKTSSGWFIPEDAPWPERKPRERKA